MASGVSWDGLRELASFRAENGCAISLYLNLDPSASPTAAATQARVHSLLDEAGRRAGANRADLTHEQRSALRADLDRLRRFLESEFDRDGARGLVVFAASLDNLWRPLALTAPVPDEVKVGGELYLTPLVPLVGQGEGALVAMVGRERGEVYVLRGGRLEELTSLTEDQPRRHDQGGWSQANYQRHADSLVHAHLRAVAQELDVRIRRRSEPRLVIVCSEETRAELSSLLANEVRAALAGWASADARATPSELLEVAAPLLESFEERRQEVAVERWREESGRSGRATAGWGDTLEAASDGRVEVLLYSQGANHPAWRCAACGRVQLEDGKCPLDGTTLDRRDEGLDLAIHQTLARGGTARVVDARQDLEPVGGIGALLRY
jgi:peptide subunit release factor 1 (eRF1)